MQNHFKKIPLILSITTCLLLVVVFIFIYKKVNSNNEKLEFIVMEIQGEANRQNDEKLLNRSIKTVKDDSQIISTHFAKSSDIVPFLDTIEGLGPKALVEAETTSVDILKDNAGLVVKVKATGTFQGVYKFLRLLENSPYELEFLGFDIQKDLSGADGENVVQNKNTNWQANFTLKLLSFIE